MQIFWNLKEIETPFRQACVTIGNFDGVHLGHRFILRKLREAAERLDGETTLVTLWPHPRTILDQADDGFKLLNTMEEKKVMLEEVAAEIQKIISKERR